MATPMNALSQKRAHQEAEGQSTKKFRVDEADFDTPRNFEDDLEYLQVSPSLSLPVTRV